MTELRRVLAGRIEEAGGQHALARLTGASQGMINLVINGKHAASPEFCRMVGVPRRLADGLDARGVRSARARAKRAARRRAEDEAARREGAILAGSAGRDEHAAAAAAIRAAIAARAAEERAANDRAADGDDERGDYLEQQQEAWERMIVEAKARERRRAGWTLEVLMAQAVRQPGKPRHKQVPMWWLKGRRAAGLEGTRGVDVRAE